MNSIFDQDPRWLAAYPPELPKPFNYTGNTFYEPVKIEMNSFGVLLRENDGALIVGTDEQSCYALSHIDQPVLSDVT